MFGLPSCDHCGQPVERRRGSRVVDIKYVLSVMVVLIWSVVAWHLLTGVVPEEMREIIARVLGTMDAIIVMVFQFHFGRSQGDDDKDTELSRRADHQAQVVQALTNKVTPAPASTTAETVDIAADQVNVTRTEG